MQCPPAMKDWTEFSSFEFQSAEELAPQHHRSYDNQVARQQQYQKKRASDMNTTIGSAGPSSALNRDDLTVVSDLTPTDECSLCSRHSVSCNKHGPSTSTSFTTKLREESQDFLPLQSFQKARRQSFLESLTVYKLNISGATMVGRHDELKILTSAFRQVCVNENGEHEDNRVRRGVVFLGGPSGAGKTSLVEELRPFVRHSKAAFCTGKFNLQQMRDDVRFTTNATSVGGMEDVVEPYAAFKAIFAELVQLILTASSSSRDTGSNVATASTNGVCDHRDNTSTSSNMKRLDDPEQHPNRDGYLREPSLDMFPHRNQMASSSSRFLGSNKNGNNGRSKLDQVRKRLKTEMEHDQLELLMDIIPQLNFLLSDPELLNHEMASMDDSSSSPALAKQDGTSWKERSDQIKYTYRRLAQIISSEFAPLVFFIDDCQWADPATLDLIASLVTDDDSVCALSDGDENQQLQQPGRILLVASYRDDEVDQETSSLAKLMKELEEYTSTRRSQGTFTSSFYHISLGNLSVAQTNELIADQLSLSLERTKGLAEIVHSKTLGNAFLVKEFLFTMARQDHLAFNMAIMEWSWDEEQIRLEYQSAGNVADLMEAKLKASSVAGQQILPLAACFGATFEGSNLMHVLDALAEEKQENQATTRDHRAQLLMCVEEGFLETVSTGVYRFVHDKVKEACLGMLKKDELKRLRVVAGDVLLNALIESNQLEESLFTVVNMLNHQINDLAKDDPKRLKLAHLNARAGRKGMKFAAFEAARKYFQSAIGLLPADKWEKHSDFTTKLYSQASSAEYCCGNFRQMDKYCDELLERDDVPLLNKIVAYENCMASYAMREQLTKNVEVGEKVLRELGISFPKRNLVIILSTVSGLIKVKNKIKKLSMEDIERMPIITDAKHLLIMELLDKFATAAFFGKQNLVPLVIFRMFEETSKHGLTPLAGVTIGLLSLIFAGILEDFQLASKCSSFAMRILTRCGSRSCKTRTLELSWAYGYHWSTPARNCLRHLMEGYTTGMETGAFESGFWCICFWLDFNFYAGNSLCIVNADIATYQKQMRDYGFEKAVLATGTLLQVVRNLLGTSEDNNKAFEESIQHYRSKNDAVMQTFVRRHQIFSCCFTHDFSRAADLSFEWVDKCLKLHPAQFGSMEIVFAAGVSCFQIAHKTKKRIYERKAKKCMRKLSSWVVKGNPNCVAQESLLKAQNSALTKNEARAIKDFEVAILLAGRRGLVHLQALANELFSSYLSEVGQTEESQYRLGEALRCYREWGSDSNIARLEGQKDFSMGLH